MSARSASYFAEPAAWRAWLDANHASEDELWVGFYKKDSGHPSIIWPEAVDGALCYGWIDGVRQGIDETRYRIRFTPRRATSIWSVVNVRRFGALREAGLVAPAGERAFAAREAKRSGVYAYEQRQDAALSPKEVKLFRVDPAAWKFFASCPPSYRRTAIFWVVGAKRAATRQRRLAALVSDSAAGLRLAHLRR